MKRYIKADYDINNSVSIADVDTKDILLDISHGRVHVLNYTFKYDAVYRNGGYNCVYNKKLIPVGNSHGIQYGVVGSRTSSRYDGGYYGYKVEGGYLWRNNWYEETQSEAIKQVRISMKTPDEKWSICGKII